MENPVTETYSDDLAGFIKRKFNPDYNIYDLLPAPRGIELKHNTAPLQKCLWTQNIGVITEGLQEYEVWKDYCLDGYANELPLIHSTGSRANPEWDNKSFEVPTSLRTVDKECNVAICSWM